MRRVRYTNAISGEQVEYDKQVADKVKYITGFDVSPYDKPRKGFRDQSFKEGQCRICGVEIIAGIRCIDCFTAKRRENDMKKAEEDGSHIGGAGWPFTGPQGGCVTTTGGTSPQRIHLDGTAGCTYIQEYDGTFGLSTSTSATATPPAIPTHALSSTESISASGQRIRTYTVGLPDGI